MGTRQLLTAAPFSPATRGITVDSIWSDVGIGTNSPEYRLHVFGTGDFTNGDAPYGLFETDGGSFGPQLRLKHNGPGGQDWVTTGAAGLKQVTERSTTALMVEALRDLRNERDAEISRSEADQVRLGVRVRGGRARDGH